MSKQRTSPLDRLLAMSTVDPDGCWLSNGQVDKDGYAMIWDGDRKARAARVVYELSKGPIPPGFVVDHECNVRRCWNPAHLAARTQLENVRRQERVASNLCKRGHDLRLAYHHEANGYVHRHCQECAAIRRG